MRRFAIALLLLCLPFAAAAEEPQPLTVTSFPEAQPAAAPPAEAAPPPYGDTYTAEELAALDKALWAGNMTRADLGFEKDFGKGYECFPVVRQMMDDPLLIGSTLDRIARHYLYTASGIPAVDSRGVLFMFRELYELPAVSGGDWSPDTAPFASLDVTPAQREVLARGLVRSRDARPALDDQQAALLRGSLPQAMVWHAIDGQAPAEQSSAELFALAAATDFLTPAMKAKLNILGSYDGAGLFPAGQPRIVETQFGRVAFGTSGNDHYTGNFVMLLEPGGDDIYTDCRIGAAYGKAADGLGDGSFGYFIDLGGNDTYDCGNIDITLGAAVMGFAEFADLGAGNDRYYAGNVSLGAAIGGLATFYDDGGSDYYSGKVYTQGAAGFGIGIMCDDSVQPAPVVPFDVETPDPIDVAAFDNDTYVAWAEAQAFARTRGVAVCANTRGNEVYQAGGVYLDAPLFTDRYASFSQGFAIGERNIDYAGGIALIADYAGNDRYLGDIYNQGVGYWYSAGLLYDGAGNDLYEMTQYGQGSGIHLAVGGLIDEGGTDTYIMNNGLGQGGSHDYAASLFMDRGGNDRYMGNTSCNGCGLTNSVGLFFDRGGDDIYAARRNGGFNGGSPARGFGSIGVLVDLAGKDDYLGRMHDEMLWTQGSYGLGVDSVPPVLVGEEKAGGNTAGFDTPREDIAMPEIIAYEGPLTQAVFDELYEIAVRWEVGDNRVITPKARERLVAFGPEVLPLLEARMSDPNSLAVRAFDDILKAFSFDEPPVDPAVVEAAARSGAPVPQPERIYRDSLALVEDLLRRQLGDPDDNRRTSALRVIGDLKLENLGPDVAALLNHPELSMQRRVIGVMGLTGSHAADEQLIAMLHPGTDEAMLKVALETLITLRVECYPQLSPLLAHPSFMVRDTLVNQLIAQFDWYKADLHDDWMNREALPLRAQRSLLQVFLRAGDAPSAAMIGQLRGLLQDTDWGMRADAVRLTEHWDSLIDDPDLDVLFSGMTGLAREVAGVREQHPELQVQFLPPQT